MRAAFHGIPDSSRVFPGSWHFHAILNTGSMRAAFHGIPDISLIFPGKWSFYRILPLFLPVVSRGFTGTKGVRSNFTVFLPGFYREIPVFSREDTGIFPGVYWEKCLRAGMCVVA